MSLHVHITKTSPRAPTPAEFELPLKPTQAASIAALTAMENSRVKIIDDQKMVTSAGVLGNKLGSGKTATMLALMFANPIPHRTPYHLLPINMEVSQPGSIRGVVRRVYKNIRKQTIIFVGASVLGHWMSEITKFCPSLKYFAIKDLRDLERFYDLLHTNLDDYQMILVKNKAVSRWDFRFGEKPGVEITKTNKSIYNIFGTICTGMCFARVVIDDFDTIGLPPVSTYINSLMTYYVSSTRRATTNRNWLNLHPNICDTLERVCVPYSSIVKDDNLFAYFNVTIDPEFMKDDMNVGITRYRTYKIPNPIDNVTRFIQLLPQDKISQVMEALNGDSPKRAAEIAGISVASPAEIFKKLLKDSYDEVVMANNILAKIKKDFYKYLSSDGYKSLPFPPEEHETYGVHQIRDGVLPQYRYPNLQKLIKDEEDKWSTIQETHTKALKRFYESVATDECGVCSMPLNGNETGNCIIPCCLEMLHADCATKACDFQMQNFDGGKATVGSCPYDRSHKIRFEELCYVDKEFKLDELKELNIKTETKIVKPKKVETKSAITKYDAVIDILTAKDNESKDVDLDVPGLMMGDQSLGPSQYKKWQPVWESLSRLSPAIARSILSIIDPTSVPRVLIFSNYDEALNKLEDHLTTKCIDYIKLGGTAQNIASIAERFQNGEIKCLVINSMKHCSGLNLQTATDMIDMHYIRDKSIFAQKTGRFVRNGRTCDATLHALLYEGEYNSFESEYVRHPDPPSPQDESDDDDE